MNQNDIDKLSGNALYAIKATDHNHHHGTNRLDSFSEYEYIDSASQLNDRVIVNLRVTAQSTRLGARFPLLGKVAFLIEHRRIYFI